MAFAERILREAERKANEIVEEAKKHAEKILQEAYERWKSRADAERRGIIEEASRQASTIIADAKRKASIVISKAKQQVVDEVFARTRDVLANRDFDAKSSLRNLIREALDYCKSLSRVIVNKRDVEIAREVLGELGYVDVEVVGVDDILGGVVVVSAEGVVVDNSFDTRLKQAEARLLDRIARLLWG